jgi:hypothetical protein
VRVTSVARETGRSPSLPCFRKRMAYRFSEAFGRRQRLVSLQRLLEREIASAPGWRGRHLDEGRMPAGVFT